MKRFSFTAALAAAVIAGCAPAPVYLAGPPAGIEDTATRTGGNSARTAALTVSGLASYYGKEFHGKKTASGEVFNMEAMTAAHRTLPFNTMVKVTNTRNGKSVKVRINDRGPFIADRIIDLSYAAAKSISLLAVGPVTVEVINYPPSENK